MTYDAEETLYGLNQAGQSRDTFASFLQQFITDNTINPGDSLVEIFEEYITERDVYDYTDEELAEMYDNFDSSTDNVASSGLTLTLAEDNGLHLNHYSSELWKKQEDKETTTFAAFDEFYHFLKAKNLFQPNAPSAEINFRDLF